MASLHHLLITALCVVGSHSLQAEEPSRSHSPAWSAASFLQRKSSTKPQIDIYYESLCPDCQKLLGETVMELWKDPEFKKLLKINLYPSGNMQATDHGLVCQHGDSECYGNVLHSCIIETWRKLDEHLPVLLCMEKSLKQTGVDQAIGRPEIDDAFDTCAQDRDVRDVKLCSVEQKDAMLEKYYNLTEKLNPQHQWVPWVLIDGKHYKNADEGQLRDALCEQMGADIAPPVCSATGLTQRAIEPSPFRPCMREHEPQ